MEITKRRFDTVNFVFAFKNFIFKPAQASSLFIDTLIEKNPKKRISLEKETFSITPLGKYQLRIHFGDFVLRTIGKEKFTKQELDYLAQNLEKSIKESPGDFRLYLVLAKIYLVESQIDKTMLKNARSVMEKGLEVSPSNLQGYWVLAQVALLENKCKEAELYAKEAFDLEPRAKYSIKALDFVRQKCKVQAKDNS